MSLPSALGRVVNAAKHGDSQILKWLVLTFVFSTVLVTVSRSVGHPKGFIRRFASGYVSDIDAAQKSMFQAPQGAKIGWTQVAIIFALLGIYGVVPEGFLLLIALGIAVFPPISIRWQIKKRRDRIDDQAHGFALSLANALKATASIGDAMKGATDDDPIDSTVC